MDMPKPGPAHMQLERLVGKWVGEEKMHPSPWDPKGGMAQATISNRVDLDGFVVIGDYQQARDGVVTFRGHGVYTIDAANHDVVCYWFDTMGQAPDQFRGRFDGDRLTLTQKIDAGFHRLTYHWPADGSLTCKMEMSQDGAKWGTMFEGVYRK